MTELYINKQLVVLPESFSISIIEENPFFSKNGKYSYDITLSLLDPINAKIYKHLNRINNNVTLDKDRSAYLVVDNEVVLNGTEVILEHSETEVKIQLVSGNSELNFLIGGDRKLRELDLGQADKYTGSSWMDVAKKVYLDLDKVYPERNWVLTPYTAGYDTNIVDLITLKVGNYYGLSNKHQMPGIPQSNVALPEYQPSYSGQVPQPYLCFIIRRVLENLGYNLEYNALEEDSIRKQFYIVHGFRTLKFAKMLPNWTVVEFFDNLESWLDATVLINPYNKSVRIEFNYQAARDNQSGNSSKEEIEILDEYRVEYDEDKTPRIQSSNVGYDLDDDDYYRYMNIDPNIRRNAERWHIYSLQALKDIVVSNPNDSSLFNYIYPVAGDNSDFIAYKMNKTSTIKKIDSFKPLYLRDSNSDDLDILFKIVPASFVSVVQRTSPGPGSSNTNIYTSFWVQIPVAEDYDDLLSGGGIGEGNDSEDAIDKIGNVQDAIEGGSSSVQEKGGSRMRLAIYMGTRPLNRKDYFNSSVVRTASYPFPFVEDLYEDYPESKEERYVTQRRDSYNPFRLSVMNEEIYKHATKIDMSKMHKLTFMYTGRKKITSVFIANNKEYRCAKIERIVTDKGFDKIVKGDFYPHG